MVKRPCPAMLRSSQVGCWCWLVGSQFRKGGKVFTLGVGWLVHNSEDGGVNFTNYRVLLWQLIY